MALVIGFSLAIYYWAERLPMDVEHVHQAVKADQRQLASDQEKLNVPG